MRKSRILLLFVISLLLSDELYADSPLTSTVISNAYKDLEIVQLASAAGGKLTPELMSYLIEKNNPVEEKIAVINALGWNFNGKSNSTIFFQHLKQKYQYKNHDQFLEKSDADLIICMAYLKALDNYFDVNEAIVYARKAKSKNGVSYTINIICALIEAQKVMGLDWCGVYRLTNNVRRNTSLHYDMRQNAIDIIFEYMDGYKNYCP